MKSIDLMIQVNKSILEEKRRDLALVINEEEVIENKINKLEIELKREQLYSKRNLEIKLYLESFAREVRRKTKLLNNDLSKLRLILEKLREQVSRAYVELRKFEITKENQQKKEIIESERLERIELDEISINMHRRKGKGF